MEPFSASSTICAMDDQSLPRKVAGQEHGRVCSEAADFGSRGAEKRRRLEVAESTGPSGSPAPPAGGGATNEIGNAEEYEEMCYLGSGGYGMVRKARHRATGRIVAIKFLTPYDEEEEARCEEDMLREARFLEACDGVPFVVGFQELVRYPACPDLDLVMEFVGPSMAKFLGRLKQEGSGIPESTLRAVMWQLLTATKGIHARGIIHRDINPENVLVADDLRAVKLCDFGFAMYTSDRPPYEPAGEPGYRAPEILLELPEYDGRVDTWSLGCVMAEIVTGRPLFESRYGNPEEDLLAILGVLGVPDNEAWPCFLDTPFATKRWKELTNLQQQPNPNLLRELIPETMLSNQGFEVLSGLLVCNPDNRLTAAAALKLPWFADKDALEKKVEATSALPKEELLAL